MGKPNTTEPANGVDPQQPCSRFDAERVEELLQISNDLSEGDDPNSFMPGDLADLCLYLADEVERSTRVYQERLMEIANTAVRFTMYPENAHVMAPGSAVPDPESAKQLDG